VAIGANEVATGWTLVGEQISGTDTRTRLYSHVAILGEANTLVSLTYAASNKIDLSLSAYSGTSSSAPIATFASAAERVSRTTHTTPAVNVTTGGSWVVWYWVDKSSGTATWTPPAGQVQRAMSLGSGSGLLTSLVADSGAAFARGLWPGQTATADSASARATMWTVVLNSAP
jgi:hypothetical protein